MDSLKFDRSIAADVKAFTGKTFKVVDISNVSGKEIPAYLNPKMISYRVEKSFDLSKLEIIKDRAKNSGYNIYYIDQQDGYITIIISKLNQ